jgi:hypothetical protein
MLDRLAHAIERHCPGLWSQTAVPKLSLVSLDELVDPIEVTYEPMICFIADGAKRTAVGERSWITPRGQMALFTLDLPVTAAFEKVPYRTAVMRIDSEVLASVQLELAESEPQPPVAVAAAVTAPMSPELVDAVTRWVQLLDSPEDIGPLASRIETEILYRLLRSPLGPVLRHWSLADSTAGRIRTTARWIRDHCTEPLGIDEISEVGWSLTPHYGVLFTIDALAPFASAVTEAAKNGAPPRVVFIVTDSPVEYQTAAERLPIGVETVRLYEDYLSNYTINVEEGVR